MKRFLLGFIVALTAMVMMTVDVLAYTAKINGVTWTYTVSGGEASIGNDWYSAIPSTTTGAITIPSSLGGYPVTSIGDHAFEDCYRLTSITIPDSVTSIGDYAFSDCDGLTSITIPDSVMSIGDYAFFGCDGLTSVTIPNSVTSIGKSAFWGCSGLTKFIVDSNNPIYKSVNGLLLTKDGKTLIAGINGNVVIPQGVTSIGNDAFSGCSGLTSITIPNSVMSIGDSAFEGCHVLTSVTIPNSVTSIGDHAFDYCDGLTSVTIGDSVKSIGDYAFEDCSGLTSVTIPNSVTSIGDHAFSYCSGLTSVTIPNSVTSIGGGAFFGCDGLTSITIPNSVTSIGGSAFSGCSGLTSVTMPNSVTSIGGSAFSGCSGLTSVTIPNSVTSIGVCAFSGCSGLTSVTIPASVTSIGDSAFWGCSGLTKFIVDFNNPNYKSVNGLLLSKDGKTLIAGINGNVVIPDSVTSIGSSAFSGCSGLTSVAIPNSVTSIGEEAFSNCSGLTSVSIGNSVTSIGRSAFSGCSGLTSVSIGNSVTSIGRSAFSGCSGLTSITIPNSVTIIESFAFDDCSGLTSITIPNSVTSIGIGAFDGCNNIKSVTVGQYICSNGLDVFPSYQSITNVVISDSVKSIGDYAFEDCSGLTSITIPDSVTSIGDYAFSGCDGLTSITIPDSVTSIGENAFSYCSGLTSVTIPNSVTSIGRSAFSGCSGLTSVTIPNSVTSIGDYAFSYCSGLTKFIVDLNNLNYKSINGFLLTKDGKTLIAGVSVNGNVVIPDGVTSIGRSAFSDCSGLTSVTIPNSVTSIGDYAFSYCSGLTSITIPDSVTSIGDYAFSYCSGLTSITIPDSVTSIGNWAFYGCDKLVEVINKSSLSISKGSSSYGYVAYYALDVHSGESKIVNYNDYLFYTSEGVNYLLGYVGTATALTLPNNYKGENYKIYDHAFYNCSGLTSITIPNSVTSIGWEAFKGCSGLTSITIPNSVTSIGDWAFLGCNNIKSVTVGQYICSNGLDVFPSYQSIINVVISEGVTSIGEGAFSGCSGLTNVTIPDSVTSIESSAFSRCSGLTKFIVDFNNPNYKSVNGLLLSKDGKTLIAGINGNVVIPDSVTSIGEYAFSGCSGLTSVTIPDSVTSIGGYAFSGCTSLKSVTIGAGVSNIDNSLFSNCPNMEYVVLPESFVGKVDFEGIQEVYSNYKCVIGGDAIWFNDNDVTSDKNGSLRSGKISNNQSTYLEMYVEGAGRLSYKWKASSEYYDEDIFDYGYLSLDGVNLSSYDFDNYRLSGIGIGGDTYWQYVELDVSTSGSHIFRWTYCKDEIDESNVGEDCIWVDEIKFQPMNTLTFNLGGGIGTVPDSINALSEAVVILPNDDGFTREYYSFSGWSDGVLHYNAGDSFVMPATNLIMTAQWVANTLVAPTITSDDVTNGGVLSNASTIVSITAEDGVEIYYTIDGTTPSTSSIKYSTPFTVDTLGATVIKAIAVRDNYFDSEVSTFTFSRIPHSIGECLNADGLTLTTGGTSNWYRVVGDVAHDGIAALRSGAIGDNESTFVKATVSGEGTISFWWKSSSEISRKRKYDYVSFTVDGVEQTWLGGDTDWTNIVCEIAAAGEHTLEWTYQKNASNIMFEDCAWLDEVSWIPNSQGEAIPELPSSATADDVANALADSTDANLVKNITSIEMYSAYREWALSVKNASGDEVAGVEVVKASTTAWMSFALDQSKLIANEPVEGDVSIASLDIVDSDGAFEFTVNIDKIDVGDGAVEENLKKLFKIEGATSLGNDANFSSENVEIELAEPVNGDVKFKILPKDSPDSFFIRATLLK